LEVAFEAKNLYCRLAGDQMLVLIKPFFSFIRTDRAKKAEVIACPAMAGFII